MYKQLEIIGETSFFTPLRLSLLDISPTLDLPVLTLKQMKLLLLLLHNARKALSGPFFSARFFTIQTGWLKRIETFE